MNTFILKDRHFFFFSSPMIIEVGGRHDQHFLSGSMTNNDAVDRVRPACDRTWLERQIAARVVPVGLRQRHSFIASRGSTLIMLYCSHGATGLHRSSKQTPTQTNTAKRVFMQLQTQTGILMVVYEHKHHLGWMQTDTHTIPLLCTLSPATLLSFPSITAPTGAVKILHAVRPVHFLSCSLNGTVLKKTHHPLYFSNGSAQDPSYGSPPWVRLSI